MTISAPAMSTGLRQAGLSRHTLQTPGNASRTVSRSLRLQCAAASKSTVGIRLAGCGSAVPSKVLTNQDLEKLVDTNDEWITSRTGIKKRHILGEGETLSARGATASQQALDMAGIAAEDVDLIIMATSSPDDVFGSACAVQALIGAKNAAAFDLTAACSGFVMALVTVFKKEWAGITAPLYALLEGFFIGGLSAVLEVSFPGIVMQAAGLTFGTLFMMLVVYQSGLVKATENFKLGVFAATGGIAIVYLVTFVLSFFGIQPSFMYSNSWLSIGISLFVVIVAALNFIIDFDVIEQGVRQNVPKYMEWYGAFAMMVTLIWLYIEFLRLLSKLRSRD